MLYLSLALIFLGIVIFLYSLILDAKKRHEGRNPAAGRGGSAAVKADAAGTGAPAPGKGDARDMRNRGKRVPLNMPGREKGGRAISAGTASSPDREQKAVLFEDKSQVIDYSSESGSIDPSLEKYKQIKRIGDGIIRVETGGISFYMGKKLYRYDFHRVRDIRTGKNHLALFLMGGASVKLFIIEPGSAVSAAAADAFREYLRSTA